MEKIMNEIQELDKRLAEELDDLLVESKLEQPRQTRLSYPPRGMIGMIVAIKEKPRVDFKLEIYPNETEEPHFKITYQNTTCRFKLSDCSPMKAEAKNGIPNQIQKIMKEIKSVWKKNKEDIVTAWANTRPTDQNHGHQRTK
jgi:hypothetical protein